MNNVVDHDGRTMWFKVRDVHYEVINDRRGYMRNISICEKKLQAS